MSDLGGFLALILKQAPQVFAVLHAAMSSFTSALSIGGCEILANGGGGGDAIGGGGGLPMESVAASAVAVISVATGELRELDGLGCG